MTLQGYRKYSNKKVVTEDGIRYDSMREAKRGAELELLEKAGEIHNLELQRSFELIPKQKGERACTYRSDFTYTDSNTGEFVVEDCKGMRTEVYKIKKKMMLYFHGITITEV